MSDNVELFSWGVVLLVGVVIGVLAGVIVDRRFVRYLIGGVVGALIGGVLAGGLGISFGAALGLSNPLVVQVFHAGVCAYIVVVMVFAVGYVRR